MKNFEPQNNTLAAGLINDVLAKALITTFSNKLAAFGQFASLFEGDTEAPRRSLDVPLAIAGSNTLTNPTDYETGASNLGVVTVAMNNYSQPFTMDSNAILQGHELKNLAEINALKLADSLSDVVTALMVVGNFTATNTIGVASSMAATALRPVLLAAKNFRRKVLLLDGGHLSYLLPTDRSSFRLGEKGAYGFDGIYEQNRWTGATANAVGFCCDSSAIAVAAAVPPLTPGLHGVTRTLVKIPGLEMTVGLTTWGSSKTRAMWASYDIVFGAAAGINASGLRIVHT